MRPSLAIIIVSWNVCDMLRDCLQSIQAAQANVPADIDIYVVDSASSDGSADMVAREFPLVNLDARDENIGYVQGNNIIIQRLLSEDTADYIWLLNPDTITSAESIATLLKFMHDNPKAGLIGPKLLNTDLSLQECAFRFPGILQPLFDFGYLPQRLYYTAINGRYSPTLYVGSQPFRIDHPLGAAMLVRRDAVKQVGFLDPQFFMYCEEVDWGWRMHKAGWDVWLVPEATVIHHGGASSKQAKAETTAHLWESRAKLYSKHRSTLVNKLVSYLVTRYFESQVPTSEEWKAAYERILSAWGVSDHPIGTHQ